MTREIKIPEGYEARIEGNKVIIELEENKDERIRKDIITLIKFGVSKGSVVTPFSRTTKDEALAYLEKQKEQKPESCDCSRDEESYTNGIHHVLMNPEAYGLIKQKPAEQLGGTFTSYDMAKTFTEGQNYVIAHPEKFGLCKPAEWSEEDKKRIKQLIYDTEHIRAEYEKRKYELGECFNDELIKDCDEQIAWLKSLRPSWKPSEEQMNALWEVEGRMRTNKAFTLSNRLTSLYNDLQKLL